MIKYTQILFCSHTKLKDEHCNNFVIVLGYRLIGIIMIGKNAFIYVYMCMQHSVAMNWT